MGEGMGVCPVHTPASRRLPAVQLAGICDRYLLSNGVEMPCLGYGTYMVPLDERGAQAIRFALDMGFRHIDTATSYKNEHVVGEVIRDSGIPRSEIFITSKLNNPDQGADATRAAFARTLSWLRTDYLDLYLIHWPRVAGWEDVWEDRIAETWQVLEELHRSGRIRAIGVSNFLVHHLEALVSRADIAPMVDQIEHNPGYQQRDTVEWCERNGVQLEAWGPLGRGRLMGHPVIRGIAERHGKDPGQVCVRYALQKGFATMPKSNRVERIRSNAGVFDFALSAEEVAALDALDTKDGYTFHPDRLDEWAERVARAHAESGVA